MYWGYAHTIPVPGSLLPGFFPPAEELVLLCTLCPHLLVQKYNYLLAGAAGRRPSARSANRQKNPTSEQYSLWNQRIISCCFRLHIYRLMHTNSSTYQACIIPNDVLTTVRMHTGSTVVCMATHTYHTYGTLVHTIKKRDKYIGSLSRFFFFVCIGSFTSYLTSHSSKLETYSRPLSCESKNFTETSQATWGFRPRLLLLYTVYNSRMPESD